MNQEQLRSYLNEFSTDFTPEDYMSFLNKAIQKKKAESGENKNELSEAKFVSKKGGIIKSIFQNEEADGWIVQRTKSCVSYIHCEEHQIDQLGWTLVLPRYQSNEIKEDDSINENSLCNPNSFCELLKKANLKNIVDMEQYSLQVEESLKEVLSMENCTSAAFIKAVRLKQPQRRLRVDLNKQKLVKLLENFANCRLDVRSIGFFDHSKKMVTQENFNNFVPDEVYYETVGERPTHQSTFTQFFEESVRKTYFYSECQNFLLSIEKKLLPVEKEDYRGREPFTELTHFQPPIPLISQEKIENDDNSESKSAETMEKLINKKWKKHSYFVEISYSSGTKETIFSLGEEQPNMSFLYDQNGILTRQQYFKKSKNFFCNSLLPENGISIQIFKTPVNSNDGSVYSSYRVYGSFHSFLQSNFRYDNPKTLCGHFRNTYQVVYDDFFEGKLLLDMNPFESIANNKQMIDIWSSMYNTYGVTSNSREIRFEEKRKQKEKARRKINILLTVDSNGHFKTLTRHVNK